MELGKNLWIFLISLLFFQFSPSHAKETQKELKASDLVGVRVQFQQPLTLDLGRYKEDEKAKMKKGDVQYFVTYDVILRIKDKENVPFCTFSIVQIIKHHAEDYAAASSEILEKIHQRKTIFLDTKLTWKIKAPIVTEGSLQMILETENQSANVECRIPETQEDTNENLLVATALKILLNNKAKLMKNGKEYIF